MKNKIIVIVLFILFALPIPVAMLGSLLTLLWFFASIAKEALIVEIIMALLGVVISTTYIFTYVRSLSQTRKDKKVSVKTFFPLFHCLVAFLFLLSLTPVGKYISNSREHFGFAKKDFEVVEQLDTHGGFHGDGYYYLILDCSDNKEEALDKIKEWKQLPLSENLGLFVYGGLENGTTLRDGFAEVAHIPKIENGCYIFEDRNFESIDATDDTNLFSRGSYNFSMAIYDLDTEMMYYFEYDT